MGTVFKFFTYMGRRVWVGRQWVFNKELEEVMTQFHGSTTITKEDLVGMIPTMTTTQIDTIYSMCRQKAAFELKQEMHRATFLKLLASIRLGIDKISTGINEFSSVH